MICKTCSQDKPEENFYFRKNRGKHYSSCKACWTLKGQRWVENNRERARETNRNNRSKDLDKARERERQYQKIRYSDPLQVYNLKTRTVFYKALKGRGGFGPVSKVLGYSLQELKDHLERSFKEGMSWENYGEWHIDHIRPLCSFTILSRESEDFKEAWSLQNIQPLWAMENSIKARSHDKEKYG